MTRHITMSHQRDLLRQFALAALPPLMAVELQDKLVEIQKHMASPTPEEKEHGFETLALTEDDKFSLALYAWDMARYMLAMEPDDGDIAINK